MKQTITISSTKQLDQFRRDFQELADTVQQADGRYVLFVDTVRGRAAKPSIISKSDFDRAVSPAMHLAPAAFSKKVAGGRFLPERLDAAYGALARAQAQHEVLNRGAHKILNRRDYIKYYYGSFEFYPPFATPLNGQTAIRIQNRPKT